MESRTKRIAHNTALLYIRTFITMIVGLYTGRVMLEALGIDNYGIQNVVGGIIGFTTIITSTMAGASSRFITVALGKNDLQHCKIVFSNSLNVQILMGIIAVVLLEIIGVWFLNTTANIPSGRIVAANWVLQFSIVITFIGLLNVPFSAEIIAHEKMSIYAYMSIFETVLKLIIVLIINSYPGDRLIFWSFLSMLISLLTTLIYIVYCKRLFPEINFSTKIDKFLIKEMTGYSWWNLFNNTSWVFSTQGVNMLINIYFGVAYNAARGVAMTVDGCVQSFVGNFSMAFRPQITKSYSAQDFNYSYYIANKGARITWLLMLVFIVPVCLEANMLLSIWLIDVPPLAGLFLILTMFQSLAHQSGNTLFILIQANGNVRRYSLFASIFAGLVFPLSWIAYKLGAPVWSCYIFFIIVFFGINVIRLIEINRIMSYQWKSFVTDVLKPCLITTVLSFSLPLLIALLLKDSIIRFCILIPLSVLWTLIITCRYGLDIEEKEFLVMKVKSICHNIFNHSNK